MPFFSAKVPPDFEGKTRLDKYIASLPNGMNRSKLKSGVLEILINGNPSKLSSSVQKSDQIDIQWEDNIPTDIVPEDIPLEIVFENEDVTVVDKKQGMVTHPASGNWTGTLVNALLFHWGRQSLPQKTDVPPSELLAQRRPGIVHRLDKDTSGLIITAKNREAEEDLQKKFQSRKVTKEYIAIVKGRLPEKMGDIKTQIIRDPSDRKRFKAVPSRALSKLRDGSTGSPTLVESSGTEGEQGKFAWTQYREVKVYGKYSLVRLRLKTGRTHQIRVHLKYLGCPILGDPIYGGKKKDELFPNATLMLHAYYLKIALPNEKTSREFKSRVPARFLEVMKKLKSL